MRNTIIFISGITGASLFILTAIIAGLLFDDYSHVSQYISEGYAFDAPYGPQLRWFGYIPSGILMAVFGILGSRDFQKNSPSAFGLIGLSIFYGIGTVIVSLFPCDAGCNREFIDPSTSQIIHTICSVLTYTFTPVSLFLIGLGLTRNSGFRIYTLTTSLLSGAFVALFLTFPNSDYAGLNQRAIEGLILAWIISYSIKVLQNR